MNHPGSMLIIAGVVLIVGGLLWMFGPWWLGRLPGDIVIDRGNTKVYIPLATCLLLSLILSGLLWLVRIISR